MAGKLKRKGEREMLRSPLSKFLVCLLVALLIVLVAGIALAPAAEVPGDQTEAGFNEVDIVEQDGSEAAATGNVEAYEML
ncbi:MAG: hypothetical protein SWK76_06715 [Actinomycetota bacterium]|nr:hypothetical protein [Actinomycetota bacterium]